MWNVGDAPIEGFSNLLYTILLVVLGAVGAPLADSARLVSLVATAAALFFLRRLCLTLNVPRPVADLVPLLAISHPTVAAYAGAGLETNLFALLIVLTFVAFAEGRLTGASWFAAAAWATRPDGLVVFAVLAVMEGHRAWMSRRTDRLRRLAVPFSLTLVALSLFRYVYFGDVIPNSVRAKAMMGSEVVLQGVTYILSSVGSALTGFEFLVVLAVVALTPRSRSVSILGPALAAVGVAALFHQEHILGQMYVPHVRWAGPALMVGGLGLLAIAVRRLPRPWLPVLLFCVSFTAAVVLSGGDWMSGERYLSPVLLLVPALAGALLSLRWDTGPAALRPTLLVLGLCLVGFRLHATTELYDDCRLEESELNDFAVQGRVLRNAGLDGRTVAMAEAGVRAFIFNGPVLDMCGLSNRHLATLPAGPFIPGHSRCNEAAALEQRPDLVFTERADGPGVARPALPTPTYGDYRLIVVELRREQQVTYLDLWARPDHFDTTVQLLRSAQLR